MNLFMNVVGLVKYQGYRANAVTQASCINCSPSFETGMLRSDLGIERNQQRDPVSSAVLRI